jgi:glycogen operon protein
MTLFEPMALQGQPLEEATIGPAIIPASPATRITTGVGTVLTPPVLTTARGHGRPFGVTWRPDGVNFALLSRHARSVQLVLYREDQEEPLAEITLDPAINKTGDVWHILIRGLPPNVLYGYRIDGPYAPRAGHRFNLRTTLIDPYARAISGGHPWGSEEGVHINGRPARLGRIIPDDFDWEEDIPPSTPLSRTVLYELHLRGYTRHPSSRISHPGTYLGLCARIPYLKSLGVTAVQLMPVLEFDELDQHSRHPGTGERLKNYWGYAPISFFAPKAGYAAQPGGQVREFKEMVKAFHHAGIEVILDVVYNHTGEGNENGPTLSFRGLDNAIFYMLDQEGRYHNFAGCGNTLNCNHPVVRDLIIDSLSYLVAELHVDGFRFDLASVLGRGLDGRVLEDPPLLRHIAEHPLLAGTKLVAEAWDAAGLSQLGKFPAWGRWAELNGWFRDDVRRFLRSEPNTSTAVAKRICGSMDLYGDASRHPYHSINFVTCHDGFTLNDLVSYNYKHNWANGETNRDGWNDNLSYNCGHEGPTDNPAVNALRQRQMRNFLALLFISQGVPLLLQGDEFGRTQQGNNNAYCQDNEVSWVDWNLAERNAGLLRFTRMMIALRKLHFARGREEFMARARWHGTRLGDPDWTGQSRTLALQLHGQHGQPDIAVLFNTHWEHQRFNLPSPAGAWRWHRLVDTALPSPDDIVEEIDAVLLRPSDHYMVSPRSTVILIGK